MTAADDLPATPAPAHDAASGVAAAPPLAVVTGASSGIGFELAKLCARDGFSLVIAADRGDLDAVAGALRSCGAPRVDALQVDLATAKGVDQLCERVGARPVEALLCNAGHGLGHAFLDQDLLAVRHVVDTHITGTIDLVHRLGRRMRERGRGRILFTGALAGVVPGAFQAVYNGTQAFIDSFAVALRNELKDTGITVTVLMPGATDTRFFERAGLQDARRGADREALGDPADVAREGFDAMMKGEATAIPGFRKMAEPGTAARMAGDDLAATQEGHDVDDIGHSPLREHAAAGSRGLPDLSRPAAGPSARERGVPEPGPRSGPR